MGSQCLGRDSGHRGRDVWVPGFRGRLRLRFWNASAAGSSLQAEVLLPTTTWREVPVRLWLCGGQVSPFP